MTLHLTADAYIALAAHHMAEGNRELALRMIDYANVARWKELNNARQ